MTGVRYSKVTKRFGKVVALADLDLAIEPGEFVSFLGPSGSGKTTSLNLLAGLLECDEGDIHIGETRVNGLAPDKRNIAMVFQSYALYPHMTIAENLAFPLRARGRRMPEAQIGSKVAQVAQALGIDDLLQRFPKELSGGQQQRVALGRALIRDPQVFLLDEPLSNLDARLRIRMRQDLKALHRQLQSTIVYVTHDQAEAMTLSSRVAVFNQGRLQQFGTPAEIYNKPVNMFVANFLGEREITFVEGELSADGDRTVFQAPGMRLPVPSPRGIKHNVTLGLRVESLQPVPNDQAAPIVGQVTQMELSGPDVIVYVRVDGSRELPCRADANLPLKAGDTVGLRPVADRLYLFDPETRQALI